MSNLAEKIIKPKIGLMELAKQLGNISKACKALGYSRDSYYRFQKFHAEGGEFALHDLTRKMNILIKSNSNSYFNPNSNSCFVRTKYR